LKQRVITGAGFAVLMLLGIILGGWVAYGLISLAMVVSTYEVYKAIRATGIEPVRWAGYVFCGLTIIAAGMGFFVPDAMHISTIALLLSVMAAMTRLVSHGKIAIESLMATVFPMLYPGLFFVVLLEMLHLKNDAVVTLALAVAFLAASINDVFALFAGLLFGKHKLSPVLSPKKTIEGSIGGLIASTIFCMVLPGLLKLIFSFDPDFALQLSIIPPIWSFGILGLVAGIFSQIGDLSASMLKRHCSVKDFGSILPGHGGIMDRMDGILFCGAACYIFFRIAGLG